VKKLLNACIFASMCAGLVNAQGGPPRVSVAFAALDTDHDGTISADEIANAPASLKSLDKNNDGKITEDEVRPMGGRGGGEGRGGRGEGGRGGEESSALKVDDLVKSLMAFDANGDGKLEKSEVPERMQGLFDRGDLNKDGVLTGDEIRALAQAQIAAANSGPGEGEGRGGRGEGEGRGGRGGPQGGMMRMDPILNALDQNHDGVISAEEIAGAPAALKTLDKNQDGKITQDEVPNNFGPGRGRGGQGR
jgi:Ca2+-binding EF-hand superfamily protein